MKSWRLISNNRINNPPSAIVGHLHAKNVLSLPDGDVVIKNYKSITRVGPIGSQYIGTPNETLYYLPANRYFKVIHYPVGMTINGGANVQGSSPNPAPAFQDLNKDIFPIGGLDPGSDASNNPYTATYPVPGGAFPSDDSYIEAICYLETNLAYKPGDPILISYEPPDFTPNYIINFQWPQFRSGRILYYNKINGNTVFILPVNEASTGPQPQRTFNYVTGLYASPSTVVYSITLGIPEDGISSRTLLASNNTWIGDFNIYEKFIGIGEGITGSISGLVLDVSGNASISNGELNMNTNKIINLKSGTNPGDAINKSQLDLKADLTYVDTLNSQNVKLTGNQSIGGQKTFTSIPLININSGQSSSPHLEMNNGALYWMRFFTNLSSGNYNGAVSAGDSAIIFTQTNPSSNPASGVLVIAPHDNTGASGIKISPSLNTSYKPLSLNGQKIQSLANGVNSTDAINKSQLDSAAVDISNNYLKLSGGTLTGNLTFSSGNINAGTSSIYGRSLQAVGTTSINTQGAHLQWNRDLGGGKTYLLNQKGSGVGGVVFGAVDTFNNASETMFLTTSGNLNIGSNTTSSERLRVEGNIDIVSNSVLKFSTGNRMNIGQNITNAYNNTIAINTSSSQNVTTGGSDRCYVAPIRNQTTSNVLFYDSSTNEVSYGSSPVGAYLPISGGTLTGTLTMGSGANLDMSNNNILSCGTIKRTNWNSREIIQTQIYTQSIGTLGTGVKTIPQNTPAGITWLSFPFASGNSLPSTSIINIEIDAPYFMEGGAGDYIYIEIINITESVTVYKKYQYWNGANGGGTRGSTILPLSYSYKLPNDTLVRTFHINVGNGSTDDNLYMCSYSTGGAHTDLNYYSIKITEIKE